MSNRQLVQPSYAQASYQSSQSSENPTVPDIVSQLNRPGTCSWMDLCRDQASHLLLVPPAFQRKETHLLSLQMSDRLSGLPLPVRNNVLSFLPAREMVRTSVLSKLWRNIWRSVPFLDIDSTLFSSQDTKFWNFAYYLLLLRDVSNLYKFRLSINCYSRYLFWTNKFITYAVIRNAPVIDINIVVANANDVNNVQTADHLTSHLFTCESLTELKLSSTHLTVPSSISLPALRVLHLCKVIFLDDRPSILFSAITDLETLILDDCLFHNKERLSISSHQLKTLILKGRLPKSIEINTPSLVSIELGGDTTVEIIKFGCEVIHLRDANIPLLVLFFYSASHLFNRFHTTQSLTLSSVFILSLALKLETHMSILKCNKASFPNLKWLKIGTCFTDYEMLVINTVLDCSPKIENIVLENETGENALECSAAEKVLIQNRLCHLKAVTIRGFRGSQNEEEFVKLILENAIVLEKLIIMTSKTSSGDNQDMMKIGKKLLACQRASSTVGILFG